MTGRNPMPDVARAFAREHSPALRKLLDALPTRPAGLVLVHASRPHETALRLLGDALVPIDGDGTQGAAAPIATVRELARQLVPDLAPRLLEERPPGETWCLVLGPHGAGVVPLVWPTQRKVRAPKGRAN